MKKTLLFKTLVDILYYIHFIGLIGILFIIPIGVVKINQVNLEVKEWNISHWLLVLLSFSIYLVFLRGLYFLRKTSRYLLSQNFFSKEITTNLLRSGIHFLITGIVSFIFYFIYKLVKISQGNIELVYDFNSMAPLFLSIIGLFFIIQSKSLELAKNYKEENELTV